MVALVIVRTRGEETVMTDREGCVFEVPQGNLGDPDEAVIKS